MKFYRNIITIALLFAMFSLQAQDSLKVESKPKPKAKGKWEIGLGAEAGISFAERLPLNRIYNNIKPQPTTGGFSWQVALFVNKKHKQGKAFSSLNLSYQEQAYGTKVFDTRPEVTQGGAPVLSKATYSFNTINLRYIYNRYVKDLDKMRFFAGLGVEINAFFRSKTKLDLRDGQRNIVRTGKLLLYAESALTPNLPVLLVKAGTEFDLQKIKNLKAFLIFRKDINYFFVSGMPLFNTLTLGVEIPILQ